MTTMPILLALSKPFTKPIPFQGLCHHLGCCNQSSIFNYQLLSNFPRQTTVHNCGGVHRLIAVPPTSSSIIHVHRMFHMFHYKPSFFQIFGLPPFTVKHRNSQILLSSYCCISARRLKSQDASKCGNASWLRSSWELRFAWEFCRKSMRTPPCGTQKKPEKPMAFPWDFSLIVQGHACPRSNSASFRATQHLVMAIRTSPVLQSVRCSFKFMASRWWQNRVFQWY